MTTTEGEPKSLDFCLLSIPNISVFNFFVLQNAKYLKKQASIDEMSKKKTSTETIPQNKHLMMKKKTEKMWYVMTSNDRRTMSTTMTIVMIVSN